MDVKEVGAIVAGGASGLGAATARHLAGLGAAVAILDRAAEAAEELAQDIGGISRAVDLCEASQLEDAVGDAAEQLAKPLRLLVNCAGIAPAGKIVTREGAGDLELFARTVHVNLIASFDLMRLTAARMAATDPLPDGSRGLIINTASIAAEDGQVGQCAYAASKGGVASMTLPAARELGRHGIRVVAIAPGVFETPMMEAMPAEVQQSLSRSVPYPKRLGQPQEFAHLVQHLIANDYFNGCVLRLDGALRMA
ncbi:MAG: SDR family NAD(P)-dependent oxidoreductase [Geminicoccaceae bacterium]